MTPPIGILGGTFDPIHHGHLRLAQEALEQCHLAAVRFVPSGTPPHRTPPHASARQRLEMVRLAVQENPQFTVDEHEIYRTDACYTVDTLSALRDELGAQQPLCLLLGSDAFLLLHTWHEWQRLFDLAHIVVMQRGAGSTGDGRPLGNAINDGDTALRDAYRARLAPSAQVLQERPAGAIMVAHMSALEISATDIRTRCAEGKNIHYLLPQAVGEYIQSHGLYTC
ncbi:MAG: nicotinate-nucleotide adenylyltransferase [Gallionellaceae bacterium]|nr:nicotinate-nucleotide adenylyltransferase [Gallionellaceae bacterium]